MGVRQPPFVLEPAYDDSGGNLELTCEPGNELLAQAPCFGHRAKLGESLGRDQQVRGKALASSSSRLGEALPCSMNTNRLPCSKM